MEAEWWSETLRKMVRGRGHKSLGLCVGGKCLWPGRPRGAEMIEGEAGRSRTEGLTPGRCHDGSGKGVERMFSFGMQDWVGKRDPNRWLHTSDWQGG